MQRRVLIYGGTDVPGNVGGFVSHFVAELLAGNENIVVVNGGFRQYRNRKALGAGSVDASVIDGARAFARSHAGRAARLSDRLETWLPAERLDRADVQRFRTNCGRIVRLPGSAQARRFAMVHGVDAIITVHGEHHTRAVLDLAFTFDNPPTFPLPFTGSISREYWAEAGNRQRIIEWFALSRGFVREIDRLQPDALSADRIAVLSSQLTVSVGRAIRRSCLVLMPFGGAHDRFYDIRLRPIIERSNFRAVRLDREIEAGHIPTLFVEHLRRHDAFVVDVTGWRPNVTYELGAAHVSGIQPFLLRRSQDPVPFYFSQHMRFDYRPGHRGSGEAELARRLSAYLDEMRAGRGKARESADSGA